MQQDAGRYIPAARHLHWATAALVLTMIPIGFWMREFPPADDAFKFRLYNIHESLGIIVFLLALTRLWVRWNNPPPPLPEMPKLMHVAAEVTHTGLYVLLVAMPIVGFLGTNAWGFPLRWFEIIPIPSPIGKNEAIAPILSLIHRTGGFLITAMLLAHIGGALFHHIVRKDGVLRRML